MDKKPVVPSTDTALTMLTQLESTLDMLSAYLDTYGIKMYIDRVILAPKDCIDRCVDYVVRIEFRDPILAEKFRQELKGE